MGFLGGRLRILLRRSRLLPWRDTALTGLIASGRIGRLESSTWGVVEQFLEEQFVFGSLVRTAGTLMVSPDLLQHVKEETEQEVLLNKNLRKAKERERERERERESARERERERQTETGRAQGLAVLTRRKIGRLLSLLFLTMFEIQCMSWGRRQAVLTAWGRFGSSMLSTATGRTRPVPEPLSIPSCGNRAVPLEELMGVEGGEIVGEFIRTRLLPEDEARRNLRHTVTRSSKRRGPIGGLWRGWLKQTFGS